MSHISDSVIRAFPAAIVCVEESQINTAAIKP